MVEKPKRNNKFVKTYSFGRWIKKPDRSYRWRLETTTEKFDRTFRSWVKEGEPTVSELMPESQGLSKQASIDILFKRETPSLTEFDGVDADWWHVVYEYKIPETQGNNIWLRKSKDPLSIGKLYLLSIDPDYCCSEECGFESTENYTVHKGKPRKIEPSEAAEIAKTTKLIFGKLIDGDQFAICV